MGFPAVMVDRMELRIEAEVQRPSVLVQLASVRWGGTERTPSYEGYAISQRLSENHPPLRIDNLRAPDVLPRVRSVGFLPPGSTVDLLPIGQPLRVLYCVFDERHFEQATQVPRAVWEEHVASLVSIKNARLEMLMQEIQAELLQPGFGSELLIEATCMMVVVELARHVRQLPQGNGKGSTNLAMAPWQMRRIQERIRDATEIGYPSIAELASLCGVSQGHLARTFKATTGWQLHRYIAEERLQAAKELLAHADLSCEEVAAKLGFTSAAYFSTAFRRMTGKTPTEFRLDYRGRKA